MFQTNHGGQSATVFHQSCIHILFLLKTLVSISSFNQCRKVSSSGLRLRTYKCKCKIGQIIKIVSFDKIKHLNKLSDIHSVRMVYVDRHDHHQR